MGKRKIAMLTASWDGEYLEAMIGGIKERLAGSGMDLYVFMCFPGFGLDSPENFGNYNIFSLPNYDDYDGFIVSINVVDGYEMLKKFHQDLLTCGKPMVSVDCEMEGITSVIPDGYGAEYRLVEHLIVEHGCRQINYIGGSAEHPDNEIRKRAYIDALTAHGIPVDERRIREYHFLDSDGRQAYREFQESGVGTPDAVVCANDAMALGYCQAAEEDGKYPPKDFLIVGYDNDENSKAFTPLISTVDKDTRAMGYESCDILLRIIAGETMPETIVHQQKLMLRGSCGCDSPEEQVQLDNRQLHRKIYYKVKEEKQYYERLNAVRGNLALSENEGMFNYYLIEIMKKYNIYGYCMCVDQDVYYDTQPLEFCWVTGYNEEQYVLSGMRGNEPQEEPSLNCRKDLVPQYLRQNDAETHDYLFAPLQKFGARMGYLVMVDATSVLCRRMLLYIVSAINSAYSNLRNLENLRKMNKRLDNVYVKDALTDMYNRFGYMRDGYAMFEKSKVHGKPLMVMFMDMDRLKEINDIYGHSHGDNALILFSSVLKTCAGSERIAVRYGGDEFLVIGPVDNRAEADAFKQRLEEELEKVNERDDLPYRIEASIGYVLTDAKSKKELDDYVEAADVLMYEVKEKNRKNRKSYSEK